MVSNCNNQSFAVKKAHLSVLRYENIFYTHGFMVLHCILLCRARSRGYANIGLVGLKICKLYENWTVETKKF